MSGDILGLGTARPERIWSRQQLIDFATPRAARDEREARQLAALHRRSGVRERALVADAQLYPEHAEPDTAARMERYALEAGPLAAAACAHALRDGHIEAPSITHLVTVSCTGFASPGVEFELIRSLDLSPDVSRTHLGFMGCHGLLNGLGVALSASREAGARALVCAVELCSLHFRYGWDPDRLVPAALFGDGAAAFVIGAPTAARTGVASGASPRATSGAETRRPWRVAAVASRRLPDSADAMSWRIGSHGFEMTLSARVPELIAAHLRPWMEGWLATHGLTVGSVGSWAIHPGGPRVLDAAAAGLELSPRAVQVSREVLAEHGNMSSATVGFLVQRLADADAPLPCVALAFGPGLVGEAVLFVDGSER